MANTTRVVMPQLGESVHEGTISKWLVKVGDRVVEFEPMLEVDTDKVNAEVPAPVTGILREILAKEGETVQAGAEIAVVDARLRQSYPRETRYVVPMTVQVFRGITSPESRRKMIERGTLFGVPGYRWLPAKGRVTVQYSAFITTADAIPNEI